MSWLTNLAGKAEDILNKIDSETAFAFAKEKRNADNGHQSTILPDHRKSSSYSFPSSSSVPSGLSDAGRAQARAISSSLWETGSLSSSPKKKMNKAKDQEQSLIDFLNHAKKKKMDTPVSQENDSANSPPSEVGHSRHSSVSSGCSFLAVSGRDTPGFTALEIVDTNSGGSHSSDAYVTVENPVEAPLSVGSSYSSNFSEGSTNGKDVVERQSDVAMLRREILSLNQEMTQVLNRAKEAERDAQRYRDQVSTLSLQQKQSEALLRDFQERELALQGQLKTGEEKFASLHHQWKALVQKTEEDKTTSSELQAQNQRLLQGAETSNTVHSDMLRSVREKLREAEEALAQQKENAIENEKGFSHKIAQLEDDQKTLSKELSECQQRLQEDRTQMASLKNQISSLKSDLNEAREELSDYKAKAGRILQSKDLLIASLKEGSCVAEGTDVHAEELEQLRDERELLREELERCGQRIKDLSGEMTQTEVLAQQDAKDALQKMTRLQEELSKEQSDSVLSLDELRQCQQELRCLQEELTRQKVNLSSRIEERDGEIQRLQKQIAHKQSSLSSHTELENRIHTLTESLIHKQTTIESLSTDKHTLQIQLERLQTQYNESQKMLNKDPVIDLSHDEVRNRVPSLFVESPFDGGVTRRVKKAYGSLDKFSVRLGVFLRRYPIARVFVLLYMGLLHTWVMIVLLTYKPEIHGDDFSLPHAK